MSLIPCLLFAHAAWAAWPLSGTDNPDAIQDPFGPRLLLGVYDHHRGLDLDGVTGDPVYVVADGTVVRVETEATTLGTARASYGNWVLVRHASLADATPVHSAYLHLDAFSVAVGDVVSEGDALGEVGSSGDGTRTDHLHLQVFNGLVKTAVKKEKSVSPFTLIEPGAAVLASIDVPEPDVVVVTVAVPRLDAMRVEIVGTVDRHVVDFETGEGLCGDVASCDGALIEPSDFRVSSVEAAWTFTVPDVGVVVSVDVFDSAGDCVATW